MTAALAIVPASSATVQKVSCKALGTVLKIAKKQRVPDELLTRGLDVDIGFLRNPKNHVDWSMFAGVLRNSREVWSLDELCDFGVSFMRSPFFSYVGVLGRLLFNARDLFDWICKRTVGGGAQLFSDCVRPSYEHAGSNSTIIRLEIQEPCEVSDEFFWMTRGAFIGMPRLVGAGYADVDLSIVGHVGEFRVTYKNRRGTAASLFRWLAMPFTAKAAARELKRTNEELQERFVVLEQTQRELDAYKTDLERLVEVRTSELSVARDQLSDTVVQLRDAQSAREKFFANISHEIRTPLSLVLLAAGDIEHRAGDALDDRARGALGAVSDAARKVVRLVDDLLLLAAGQEGKLRLHPETVDLETLVAQATSAWLYAAEAGGLELVTRIEPKVLATVDPVAIERVVSNLISNAVKYTPRGGKIEVELATVDNGVRLSVFDTGPGIDPDLARRLFGRFERAEDAHRRSKGTGIGLSLLKQLVAAHDGEVGAYPRVDGGTEMRVVLPIKLGNAPVASGNVISAATPSVARFKSGDRFDPPGRSHGTILLAEDEPHLAEMVARILSDEYSVVIALDGLDALGLVESVRPELLITDVNMPRMDGVELAGKFRELTADRLSPVIIVSAVADMSTRLGGLDAGATDFVTKPFDPRELKARVRAQFRMRELAVRMHRAEQLSAMAMLTSGLAHELRNPANGVVNAIGPLYDILPAEMTKPGAPVGRLLNVMKACAEQVGTLSRQLLDIRGDRKGIVCKPSSLEPLVQRATTLARTALEGIDVRVALPDGEVSCSPSLLVQVLTNLVENAGHAAGPGGWVEIRSEAVGDRTTIEVGDSGPGVPPELRERVFEPFFTTKPPGKGTGLGLSVAREIMHRHGGVLEIRPRGVGTVFVVELPGALAPKPTN